jgi:UDP-N-acetylmuramoyl-L-alanyl-D-glutamate--2,6-diaminopimelate ligase
MRLRELAAAVGADWAGGAPRAAAEALEVRGVCADSRRVAPGELFVALPGTRQDGADYAADAVARGAAALCVERGDAGEPGVAGAGVPVLVVDDAHVALARLAAALEGHPARALRLVGVTGTLGKTSTVLLVQAALAASRAGAGGGVGTVGSLGARVRGAAAAARAGRRASRPGRDDDARRAGAAARAARDGGRRRGPGGDGGDVARARAAAAWRG